jgi:hypothetical protein
MRTNFVVSFLAGLILILAVGTSEVRAQSTCTSPADCDDHNECTHDLCDSVIGCWHPPTAGNSCTPENRCYDLARCSGGVCSPLHYACNDDNLCTDDICDPSTGCSHVNNTAPCSDPNPCTTGDACAGGSCHPGTGTRNCNDNNPCTDDSCDPSWSLGCRNVYDSAPCSDGNPCTTGDACASGFCHPGTGVLNCNDSNPCTNDSCSTGVGCVHTGNANLCLDGSVCTLGDATSAKAARATPVRVHWTATTTTRARMIRAIRPPDVSIRTTVFPARMEMSAPLGTSALAADASRDLTRNATTGTPVRTIPATPSRGSARTSTTAPASRTRRRWATGSGCAAATATSRTRSPMWT